MGNISIQKLCKKGKVIDQGELDQIDNSNQQYTKHNQNYQRRINPPQYRNKSSLESFSSYAVKVQSHKNLAIPTNRTLSRLDRSLIPNVTEQNIYQIKQKHSTYQGQFKNNIPHGKGIVHFRNGSFYGGQFVQGDADGKGVYIFPTGLIYTGQFKQSQFNGLGTLTVPDKNFSYSGSFLSGLPHGKGIQESTDSRTLKKSKYRGKFKNGKKNGFGKYYWSDGQRYQGFFRQGIMHGKGTIYSSMDKIIYDGNFRNGEKIGYGIFTVKNGSFQGEFFNDSINGQGTFVWNDGKVYEGTFLKSQMNGNGTIYYPSGQVAYGSWEKNHNIELSKSTLHPQTLNKIEQIKTRHVNNARQSVSKFNETFFQNNSLSESSSEIDSRIIRMNKWEKQYSKQEDETKIQRNSYQIYS